MRVSSICEAQSLKPMRRARSRRRRTSSAEMLLLSHSLVIRLIDFQSISDRIGADDLLPVLLAIGAVDISAFRQYPDITGLMDSDFRKKGLPYLDDRSVSHRGIGSETVAC